ncbi:MAG: TolC family outer membrane protein [Pseudomonadota bacterium]|nr:TolC family outer membrane protein [Pseudomonadota bacterium]
MGLRNKIGVAVLSLAAASGFASSVKAETLHDALLSAYRTNPTLNAARAGQRATDENVPQALSGWRPTVSTSAIVGQNGTYTSFPSGATAYSSPGQENLAIKLDQPLFRGFGTIEKTAVAEAQVTAGQQQLLATEEQVLLNVVTAYLNVQRDRKIVALRERDLGVLQSQDKATSERFKAGVLTRTDEAQSQAGVASQRAALAAAIATMRTSEASYTQYVGHAPDGLSPAPAAQPPASLDQALSIASQTNPNILAAAQTAVAADHNIGVAASVLLPQADLQGLYSFAGTQNGSSTSPVTVSSGTIQGVLTVPIYEAGLNYSQVRQAKQRASQSKISMIDTTRQVRQALVAAWQGYVSAQQSVTANASGVSASRLAYNGLTQEYQVGSRSTIDVLNAELTLLTNEIALASAQHDQILSSYQLQSAMGHLTGRYLRLGPIYDVKSNYDTVRNKWIGLDADVLH